MGKLLIDNGGHTGKASLYGGQAGKPRLGKGGGHLATVDVCDD